jgi:hypothetical protein
LMNSQSISFYFTWILRPDNTWIKLREQNPVDPLTQPSLGFI